MFLIRTTIITFLAFVTALGSAYADPALIRLSDEDTTVWVFGTFHLLPPSANWRGDQVDQALEASSAIYMEADVWSGGPAQMMGLVQAYGLMPQGQSLSSTMNDEEWRAVADFSASLGIPPEGLQPFRPWFAAITLAAQMAVAQGYDPNSGVDVQLYNQMIAEGRELRFFETAEQQLRFLADLPSEIQRNLLVETAIYGMERPDQFDQMLTAWLAGDLQQIDDVANQPLAEASPATFEALIVERNRKWVQELSDLMNTPGTFFVAVGTAHLPGEEGLIELMRAEGFEVEAR